jgi:putative ABC transport system permease protein
MLLKVATQSLLNRKSSAILTVLTLTISLFVLLTVLDVKTQAKKSFNRAVSGVDLIVGAPTGQLNLLLASVFRTGQVTNAIEADSYQKLAKHPQVDWVVPISLGDSHKGFSVIGTTAAYFEKVKFGSKQSYAFALGNEFEAGMLGQRQVVVGSAVADKLNYQLGSKLVLSHGLGSVSFKHHDHVNFEVVGVLAATGTPADQSLFVNLQAMTLMHAAPSEINKIEKAEQQIQNQHEEHEGHDHDHEDHSHSEHAHESHEHDDHDHSAHDHTEHDHESHGHVEHENHGHDHEGHVHSTEKASAVLLGLKAKFATLIVQKFVNDYEAEPLMAVLPGVALSELWRLMSSVEVVLMVIATLVFVSSLFGMSTMLLASMRERNKEIAVFRALGASALTIFMLIELEVILLTLVSFVLAWLFANLGIIALQPVLIDKYGVYVETMGLTQEHGLLLLVTILGALIVGLIPAISGYQKALSSELR